MIGFKLYAGHWGRVNIDTLAADEEMMTAPIEFLLSRHSFSRGHWHQLEAPEAIAAVFLFAWVAA